MSDTIFLKNPKIFDFKRTVLSHGWCELLPFEFDPETWTLKATFVIDKPISITISEADDQLAIKVQTDNLTAANKAQIIRSVRHIFRFDDDLTKFYRLVKKEKSLVWIAEQNAGRLLRSTTVFEDLVKTICTTNCSWAMTKIMTTNLVEKLGEISTGGKRAFPTAEAMASMPLKFYKDEIRAGYRAAYFKELADKIVAGQLDAETWLDSDLPTKDLKKEMKTVKGVGDYAAENLLKLVGRYDGLALDSWLRGGFYKKYNAEAVCDDKQIQTHYERFGQWKGLVMWCDMTEKWM